MSEIIDMKKARREERNGMTDEEIKKEIADMEHHMSLLPNGDAACQQLIDQMEKLLK